MDLSPKQIVNQLDKYIIGQSDAKKAVAIALRNRYRRACLPLEIREEITPKNIIMKGPTGVGKTEIARRLAKLVGAPFVKVEATKYTEVGYVGKDVEGMVRDLAECAYRLVKSEKEEEVKAKATAAAEKRVMRVLTEAKKEDRGETHKELFEQNLLDGLRKGLYDNLVVEMEVIDIPQAMELVPGGAAISIGSIFGDMFKEKKKKRKLTIKEAMQIALEEEASKLVDDDAVKAEAVYRAENDGIVFIDEIDKIAGKGNQNGADVSREGVQRDILPIVEGSSARSQAALIAASAVAREFLAEFGVEIQSYVTRIGAAAMREQPIDFETLRYTPLEIESSPVRCPSAQASRAMEEEIAAARVAGDTLGGEVAVAIHGVAPALGSYRGGGMMARLSKAAFSVNDVVSVSFGSACDVTRRRGSAAYDSAVLGAHGFAHATNISGGIEGGLTTGASVVMRVGVAPNASLRAPQKSIDLETLSDAESSSAAYSPCLVGGVAVAIEAEIAFALASAYQERFGGVAMSDIHSSYDAYMRRLRLAAR